MRGIGQLRWPIPHYLKGNMLAQEKMCPWCHTTKVSCVFTRGADAGIEYDCGTKVNSHGEPAHEGYNGDFYPDRNADCYEREIARIKSDFRQIKFYDIDADTHTAGVHVFEYDTSYMVALIIWQHGRWRICYLEDPKKHPEYPSAELIYRNWFLDRHWERLWSYSDILKMSMYR